MASSCASWISGPPPPTLLLFLSFLSYKWLMEMTDLNVLFCHLAFMLPLTWKPPPLFKLLPLTFLYHTSSPPHRPPSSSSVLRPRGSAKALLLSSCSCLVFTSWACLCLLGSAHRPGGWKEFSLHSSSPCLLSFYPFLQSICRVSWRESCAPGETQLLKCRNSSFKILLNVVTAGNLYLCLCEPDQMSSH